MGRIAKAIAQVEDVSPQSTLNGVSLWSKNFTGQEVVVGSFDSGALYTHEAIKGNWRAENGYFQPTGGTPTPDVAGAIALLISAHPSITYDEVYAALTTNTETKHLTPNNQSSGDLDDSKYPNNN
ncbi:hypothetical protein AC1031_009351 [Aphanomyces cochlioides]|nr:hypothetical protein AC1031_009351 [Aphanomyces cochlioides]